MKITLNKSNILKMHTVDKSLYIDNLYGWHISHAKGSKIFYLLPRFNRPKYYDDDILYNVITHKSQSKKEFNDRIKQHESLYRKGFIIEDENHNLWLKPYVKIILVNDETHVKYFDSAEECDAFIDYIKDFPDFFDIVVD